MGPDADDTPDSARETLEAILRHPASPFITMLVLGPAPADGDGQMDMQCLVDAIALAGRPRALRSLYLGKLNEWRRDRTTTGELGHASSVLGRLQTLTLDAGTVSIGELALPERCAARSSSASGSRSDGHSWSRSTSRRCFRRSSGTSAR